jgi:2-polyprenyl-6-methoxyphenol hydroxylase-like FAD-dependent oxidoreductase
MSTASESYSSTYDFIIAGGGLAGLSLAYYLSQSSLENAKILIIDQSEKRKMIKLGVFGNLNPTAFDEIVRQNGMVFGFMEVEILVNFYPLMNTNIN